MKDNEAQKIFNPYAEHLASAWQEAHLQVWSKYHHPEFNPRTLTTQLQNLAVINIKKNLIGHLPVDYFTHCNQDIFVIPGVATLVAKKLDPSLRPSYHVSKRGHDFYSQSEIPGLEASPRVICGCVLTPDLTSIQGVYITHPQSQGSSYNWALNITNGCFLVDELQDNFITELDDNSVKVYSHKNRFKPKKSSSNGQQNPNENSA